MAKITALPEEILLMVLGCVDELSQLAKCRIVCKAWCNPTEKLMLGREIMLENEIAIFRLYDVLVRNPAKAYLIKHLRFSIIEPQLSIVLIELLYLAITPNIETLSGLVEPYEPFALTIMDAVRKSSMKLDKLTSMTYPLVIRPIYYSTLCFFKETLQIVMFTQPELPIDQDFWNFVNVLDSFRNLTSLNLKGRFETVEDINTVLDKCLYLQELTLEAFDQPIVTTREDITAWSESTVKKQHHLKMLNIKKDLTPDLAEYLLYKYTKIQHIRIDIEFQEDFFDNFFDRIVAAIHQVPKRDLYLGISRDLDFRNLVYLLLTKNLSICNVDLETADFRIKIGGV
ncbi:hypothetical protein [Parasitella parasitica]|uniref:F-box domain-containing protein n=1 Tax=Parasitella parasitica TaxID=35722 RepID=A0A0B7N9K9_9FUNG|nr:hypothetical protein [Parasitella parasitica]